MKIVGSEQPQIRKTTPLEMKTGPRLGIRDWLVANITTIILD